MNSPSNNSLGIVAVLSLVTIMLGGLLVLVVIYGDDNDLTRIIGYLTAAVPVIIGFGFVANKQDKQEAKQEHAVSEVTDLKGNLNGKLDKRFADLEERLSNKIDAVAGQSTESTPAPLEEYDV